MSLIEKTAAELLALQAAGKASAAEIADAFLAAVTRARAEAQGVHAPSTRPTVRQQAAAIDAKRAAGRTARQARRRAGRGQGRALHEGRPHHLLAARCWRTSSRPTTRTSSSGCRPRTRSSSARRTWTSSRWARPPRTARTSARRNPWDTDRIPGGSVGGSAAAVAGVPGPAVARHRHRRVDPPAGGAVRHRRHEADLRPRQSRYGLVAFASSLDQVGPFAHDVADCALMLEVIAGHDAPRQHQRRTNRCRRTRRRSTSR